MPKQITGTNQTAVATQLTIGVDGDVVDGPRHEAFLQALINNDVTLETRVASFRLTTGSGITGADAGTAIGNITISIPNAGITTAMLQDALVTIAKMAANSVGQSQLVNNSVVTVKIADANVTAPKLAVNSVPTDKIVDGNVTTVKIADANVTTPKIADRNITKGKLGDDSVDLTKIDLSGTATVGQQLVVAANNRIAAEDKPVQNARGTLVATSNGFSANGDVSAWTLESGLPSTIAVGIGTSLLSSTTVPVNFPKVPPNDRVIGIWAVLLRGSTEVDAVFIPWGSRLTTGYNVQSSSNANINQFQTNAPQVLVSDTLGTGNNPQAFVILAGSNHLVWRFAIARGNTRGRDINPITTGHSVRLYLAQA